MRNKDTHITTTLGIIKMVGGCLEAAFYDYLRIERGEAETNLFTHNFEQCYEDLLIPIYKQKTMLDNFISQGLITYMTSFNKVFYKIGGINE